MPSTIKYTLPQENYTNADGGSNTSYRPSKSSESNSELLNYEERKSKPYKQLSRTSENSKESSSDDEDITPPEDQLSSPPLSPQNKDLSQNHGKWAKSTLSPLPEENTSDPYASESENREELEQNEYVKEEWTEHVFSKRIDFKKFQNPKLVLEKYVKTMILTEQEFIHKNNTMDPNLLFGRYIQVRLIQESDKTRYAIVFEINHFNSKEIKSHLKLLKVTSKISQTIFFEWMTKYVTTQICGRDFKCDELPCETTPSDQNPPTLRI